MRHLLLKILSPLLLALPLAGCESKPCATQRAALASPAPAPAALPCSRPAATPEAYAVQPVYAYGVGPNDYARAGLSIPGNAAGCFAGWASKVLIATAEGITCLGQSLVPPNPQPSLYATTAPAPAAPAIAENPCK